MGQKKETEPKKLMSRLVEEILFRMEEEQDSSPWNGQSRDKIIEILTETEDHFRTFLADKDEAPFIEFIDSDPEISDFLTRRRFSIPQHSIEDKDSILSYMRKKIEGK